MWTAIVLIVVSGVVLSFRACMALPEEPSKARPTPSTRLGRRFATVAGAFNGGTITTSFVSYATTITNSQRFQFATLKQMEIFTRTEEPSTAFGYVPLPDVAVEARAPVNTRITSI